MNSDDRFSFMLTALVAAAVILGAAQMGKPRGGGLPDPPLVGRLVQEGAMGPAIPESEGPEEVVPDEAAILAERRVRDVIAGNPWPDFARNVVFHPLLGHSLEKTDLEQGPPYHLVIEADGAVRWTERGKAGGQSQPAGLPPQFARKALHVAMPDALQVTPERVAATRVLWREATRRLGDKAVLFADEVPGSSLSLPDGFDRSPYVAPQETRPKESRPATAPSQPAVYSERVKVRFGSTTIDAGVAATAAARRDGLMGRTTLRKDEGLLFLYRTADDRSFWMKNCLMALDILYLKDDGEVLALRTLEPPDPKMSEADIPRFASPAPCRLVLEVEGGYALKRGVKKGTKLGLPENLPQLLAKADP